MSDPLSVASGVAGLLSLGIQVTQSLIDFYSSYKHRVKELENIMIKLEGLYNTLDELQSALQDRRSHPNGQEIVHRIEKGVQSCHEAIKELQYECAEFQGIQSVGRRAQYPFRKSTLVKLEENIREIRQNLSFSISVLQIKDQKTLQDGISDIRLLLEIMNKNRASQIHNWLDAPDATVDHNFACTKRHTRTGLWFVKGSQFSHWLGSENSFLWVTGFAGCGKSILCSTTIQYTFREKKCTNKIGIAFFYFSFGSKCKQSGVGLLRALLSQFSSQSDDFERELEQLSTSYKSSSPPIEILLAYLKRALHIFHESYIFLDALDEIPRYDEREVVLDTIDIIRKWCISGLHLLVTSRDEFDIRESLIPSREQEVVMRNSEIDKDIGEVISHRLRVDPKLRKWDKYHEDIKKALASKAQGVFRYVDCQFNAIKRCPRNRNHLMQCLQTLPRDMNETYERMLCNIDESCIDDVRRILTMLCFAIRPITTAELIDAHAVDLQQPPFLDREGRLLGTDGLMEICAGMLETVETPDNVLNIRIAHFSLQEYLQAEGALSGKAAMFALRPKAANAEIAKVCLVYLLDPGLSNGELSQEKLMEFPLAQFAALSWFHHYAKARHTDAELDKLVLKLFDSDLPFFETWKRLYDADHPWKGHEDPEHGRNKKASVVYYASLLGLHEVLSHTFCMQQVGERDTRGLVNACVGRFGHALQAASYGGHVKTLYLLLENGSLINSQGGNFGTALHAASYSGHEEVVRILLDREANLNARVKYHGTALHLAASRGHRQVVRLLLDRGAEVNSKGEKNDSALHMAVIRGHAGVVQELLQYGADVNAQEGQYGTAIQSAASENQKEILEILLNWGADINVQSGLFGNALQKVSFAGQEWAVRLLLDHGADVNAQGGKYVTALQAASLAGHLQVVELLLENGAQVNAPGGQLGRALQKASFAGHELVVQILLERGADVNDQRPLWKYGNALQAACRQGYLSVARKLLEQGAIVNMPGGYYGNSLQAASYEGHQEIVQLLLDHGAEINAEGAFGSALRAASNQGHMDVVNLLTSKGAKIHAQTEETGQISISQRSNRSSDYPENQSAEFGSFSLAESTCDSNLVPQITLTEPTEAE